MDKLFCQKLKWVCASFERWGSLDFIYLMDAPYGKWEEALACLICSITFIIIVRERESNNVGGVQCNIGPLIYFFLIVYTVNTNPPPPPKKKKPKCV